MARGVGRFDRPVSISAKLRHAAGVAIGEVLKARNGEKVLIVTNPESEVTAISMALYDAAVGAGAAPSLIFQAAKTQMDFADDAVIYAMRSEPEIIISVSHLKMGKDRFGIAKHYKVGKKSVDHIFNYLQAAKRIRGFWSPSVTVKMFEETVPINYARLDENCRKLRRVFEGAAEAHITSKLGTDLVLGFRGRKAFADDGDFSKPGRGGNLPAGEMYISPELGAGEGTLVFDGCISSDRGVIIIRRPIRATVKKNLITKITGGVEARMLQDTLDRARVNTGRFAQEGRIAKKDLPKYLENVCNLGELGIGLNERAKIVGNMLEDEKVFRTCHIAIGSNYDDDAKALIHLDGLVKHPTIRVRDSAGRERLVLKDGVIVV
ncbi:MAG TPA: peptidase M17 [bacterium]|nr:peptidase M17 [bacterium]